VHHRGSCPLIPAAGLDNVRLQATKQIMEKMTKPLSVPRSGSELTGSRIKWNCRAARYTGMVWRVKRASQ